MPKYLDQLQYSKDINSIMLYYITIVIYTCHDDDRVLNNKHCKCGTANNITEYNYQQFKSEL